ncbi:MAG: hypothetical protein GY716_02805, partial [bacterium]|nr:hypothetical protein [bacterium]
IDRYITANVETRREILRRFRVYESDKIDMAATCTSEGEYVALTSDVCRKFIRDRCREFDVEARAVGK